MVTEIEKAAVLDQLTALLHSSSLEAIASSYSKGELSEMYEVLYDQRVPSICRTRFSIVKELKSYVDLQRQKKAFEGLRAI